MLWAENFEQRNTNINKTEIDLKMTDENEWELSKENVQPIRQGRHFLNMSAGLHSNDDQLAQMKKEKNQFESELRTYSGDDPVEVWHRYLIWMEQNCVKGGKEYNLEKLLENYLKQFAEETRYHNDPRYVSAWIRYANMCKEPLDIYSYMFDQKIGCQLSCFYESWAWALELMGNTKKANMIYQEGIKRQAEPFDLLEKKYNNFQMRVARGLAGKIPEEAPVESVEQRAALGQLITTGKKVPVNRAENTKLKSRGLALQSSKPSQIGQSFQVFNDENQDPSLPVPKGDWSEMPKKGTVNKENDKKAGVWTKAKVPCKVVAPPSIPTFSLYVEESADQPMTTPRKLPEVGSQVLSARKPSKQVDQLHNVRNETTDPSQRAMYDKHKVYCGAEEYSFEEIRAAKWFAKKKKEDEKRRAEEEQKLIEEQKEQLRRNREMLQKEAEQFRLQQETLQREHQTFLEQYKSEMQRQQEEFKRERELMMQKQKEMLEKEIEEKMNAGLATAGTREKTSSKQLNFGTLHGTSVKLASDSANILQTSGRSFESSVMENDSSKSGLRDKSSKDTNSLQSCRFSEEGRSVVLQEPEQNFGFKPFVNSDESIEGQQNNSNRTPKNRLGLNLSSGKNTGPTPINSGGRQSLSAPSPTVNTKEAMQLVMGMFNASLAIDANLGWDEDDNMVTAPTAQEIVPQATPSAPFTIFTESQPPQKSDAPFSIFSDEAMETGHTENKENNDNRFTNKSSDFIGQRKKGRGAFQSVSQENVQSMEYEGKMETIESQARDDFTICPIGTNQSFAAAARVASTPFNRDKPLDPLHDVSRISSHAEQSAGKSSIQNYTDNQSAFQTSKDDIKVMSPIMEGSNEDSSGHNGQSTVNSVFHATGQHTQPHHTTMETESLRVPKLEDLNQSSHTVDTTQYIPSPTVHTSSRNPFDDIDSHLNTLSTPLNTWPNYFERDELLPEVRKDNMVDLGYDTYIAEEVIGKGGYAKVWKISCFDYMNEDGIDNKEQIVMKVQSPPCPWEFYICNELHNRLKEIKATVDISPAVMNVKKGFFFTNCSCILTDFHPKGTLLDLVNKLTQSNSSVGESLAMYVTIELLYLIENLHKCSIIHGDVKPDNFLLIDIPRLKNSTDPSIVFGGSSRCLQLIDFGQSIDMSKYPKGTTFMAKVKTSGFKCIEMQTNRPWTYQTDLFGLVGTIHVLVFRKYMQIYQCEGEWKTTCSFLRSWNVSLWKKLFHDCLNIPSCDELPDIVQIRREFEDYFVNNLLEKYNSIQNALSYQIMK